MIFTPFLPRSSVGLFDAAWRTQSPTILGIALHLQLPLVDLAYAPSRLPLILGADSCV